MEEKESFRVKLADIFKNFRVWVLLIFLLMSFFAISYNFNKDGVTINSIGINSAAQKAGLSFSSKDSLTNLERILYVGDEKITSVSQFYQIINSQKNSSTIKIITDRNPKGYEILINITENQTVSDYLGISVREVPTSNIKLGIELEGGSRLILKPTQNISQSQYELLIDSLQNRLDIYGASGTKVNKLEDSFSDDKFIIVESTSSNKNDIFDLIKRQGKFDAKIGNITVFTGENVIAVFNDPQHARLEGCSEGDNGFVCSYAFSIEIDKEGVESFFNQTSRLNIVGGSLSEKVSFYLDGKLITSLSIASVFKYQKITNPQITVSGNPMPTRAKAEESARQEMKVLQTILSTKSLPSELDVVQSYSISSSVGEKLLKNSILVGIAALLIVSSIVAIRYHQLAIFVGISIALLSEVIIVFGFAAFMKLSIDLAAIGGLIAAIGTGVDDQIIITDEYFRKRKKKLTSKKRLKAAIYIIMISYFTTLAAMFPLYFAGLKVLQGFAFMIIVGVTIGVFITRPAYAAYLRIMMTSKKQREEEEEE